MSAPAATGRGGQAWPALANGTATAHPRADLREGVPAAPVRQGWGRVMKVPVSDSDCDCPAGTAGRQQTHAAGPRSASSERTRPR